jgi:hypothetical protein
VIILVVIQEVDLTPLVAIAVVIQEVVQEIEEDRV